MDDRMNRSKFFEKWTKSDIVATVGVGLTVLTIIGGSVGFLWGMIIRTEDRLDRKIDQVEQRLTTKVDYVDGRLSAELKLVNERLNSINDRLNSIDGTINRTNGMIEVLVAKSSRK